VWVCGPRLMNVPCTSRAESQNYVCSACVGAHKCRRCLGVFLDRKLRLDRAGYRACEDCYKANRAAIMSPEPEQDAMAVAVEESSSSTSRHVRLLAGDVAVKGWGNRHTVCGCLNLNP
jgi:hypothetical protein